jgi:diguanylate cyclase (GGDEF)-like protein
MPATSVARPESKVELVKRAPVDDELPDHLPPFDMMAALERTNGKPKLLRKMMRSFCNQFANAGFDLREHIVEGRAGDAQRMAHSLKGIAGILEAKDLTAAAAAVEEAFRRSCTDELDSLIAVLEKELAPAIAAARSLEKKTVAPVEQPATPPSPELTAPVSRLPRLLVVDDDSSFFDLLADIFSSDYEVLSANDGPAALELAAQKSPNVILLDVMMPGIDGYEVCRRLKAGSDTGEIPIIFITGDGGAQSETKGLELGAADYIAKPINPAVVKARVDKQIALKRAQDNLYLLASTDGLTGLANRRSFDERLSYEYARHMRSGTQMSLILLDIDHFKIFNDSYGHLRGDECLRQVAQAIIRKVPRAVDLVARYGGEEFVMLLPETNLQGALVLGEKVRRSVSDLAMSHEHSSVEDHVTASLGVLCARCIPGRAIADIVTQADQQLYAAKVGGRNRICAANAV